mmetsp:Transcript_96251/g.165953  ORF Transcript_96251/g.165953 Transcript_96251/m.165953 type:complete len:82 (+) Transcript_96251:324-569(+)
MHAFALVCYALHMVQFGAAPTQNFFSLIERVLQSREPALMDLVQGYMHYLFRGINCIPPAAERVLYRGVPRCEPAAFRTHY